MSNEAVNTYVIYDHPSDYPNSFAVRRFEWATPMELIGIADTLDQARALLPSGLYNLGRTHKDDPKIVEVWI